MEQEETVKFCPFRVLQIDKFQSGESPDGEWMAVCSEDCALYIKEDMLFVNPRGESIENKKFKTAVPGCALAIIATK